MGGAVALEQALRKPEWLKGVVLLASGARLRVGPHVFEGLQGDFGRFARAFIPAYYFGEPQAEWVEAAVDDMIYGVGQAQTIRDFRACDAFDVLEHLGEITVPLLAVTGANDKMTPPKYAQALADRVPGAQARIIPGAGHFVMVERPAETNAALRTFISGIA